MKVIVAADHGGFEMKEYIKSYLEGEGYEVLDVGALQLNEEDDFVDFGRRAAGELNIDERDMGILFCRNGYGMSIVANRHREIRCGIGFNKEAVTRGRRDDNINCLSFPSDYIDDKEAKDMVDIFLKTPFANEERYIRRLRKLSQM